MELVVLVAPIASNVYATSFATCLTIIDNIMTALEASTVSSGWNEWVIRQEYATVGDVLSQARIQRQCRETAGTISSMMYFSGALLMP